MYDPDHQPMELTHTDTENVYSSLPARFLVTQPYVFQSVLAFQALRRRGIEGACCSR